MNKTLNGMTKEELQGYVDRSKSKFSTFDYSKYGDRSDLIKNARQKSLQSLQNEINEYFR